MKFIEYAGLSVLIKAATGTTSGTYTAQVVDTTPTSISIWVGPATVAITTEGNTAAIGDRVTFDVETGVVSGVQSAPKATKGTAKAKAPEPEKVATAPRKSPIANGGWV